MRSQQDKTDIQAYLKSQSNLDTLRFITCGSVDDGKSTLIGRMLFDAKCLFDDQVSTLQHDSKKHGTQGQDIDFALLVDENVAFEQIFTIAKQTEKALLKEVSLFDVYQGKNLPEGKKSYAVSFTIQDNSKTLTDTQIEKIMSKLQGNFEKQLGATLR